MEKNIAIELKDLFLEIDDNVVLENINISFYENESSLILGPSGCGKSYLLKVAAGLVPPTSGDILFHGRSVLKMDETEFQEMQKRTGFLFQESALWANRPIYDNLTLPLLVNNQRINKDELNEKISKITEKLNFRKNLSQRPDTLSAGEKKIVSYMRAVIADPEILFLDEPTSSLDRRNFTKISREIFSLKNMKKSLIMVTHHKKMAFTLPDKVIVMDSGNILESGSWDEVRKSEQKLVHKFIDEYETV